MSEVSDVEGTSCSESHQENEHKEDELVLMCKAIEETDKATHRGD